MEHEVEIPIGRLRLEGSLYLPPEAHGLVVFAHGSGSSRHSPRNQYVAQQMQTAGFGTLLFDLLTPEEDSAYENRFDVNRLAGRLEIAAYWSLSQAPQRLALGFFGASTGSAAALCAAGQMSDCVRAVVSRGGRPDLAGAALGEVSAPTLLIVGERDEVVLDLNHEALSALQCPKRLAIVPGATHLFEEPGALEEVARLAKGWFERHLRPEPLGTVGEARRCAPPENLKRSVEEENPHV
ncbi:MAG: alpha/beta family hydrolase [Bryobacterales bacterium]